jgi:hypothetical protein
MIRSILNVANPGPVTAHRDDFKMRVPVLAGPDHISDTNDVAIEW